MNKCLYTAGLISLFSGLFSPSAFSAGELVIEFSGELLSTACKVSQESVNKEIKLENLHWRTINEQGTSYATPFFIAIDKCSTTDLQKSIKLTWKNTQVIDIGNEKIFPTQGSSGVYLGIRDKDNNPVSWNKPMKVGTVSEIENQQRLNFGVIVHKPPTGDASIGDFTGTVTFAVEYE